ncbi:MAG: EscU/YscU/HrcU family type III secretion system export apparatus switch protein, partial [Pseudomonadota bacterium]|nr:EscU/YscU/HrcU family type III secretion system export apparatus switch protein [Pseudomonadota bacterium]
DLAELNGVPILEAPALARALYRYVELDSEIPSPLYAAVAEVMAWVFQLRRYQGGGGETPVPPLDLNVPPGMDPGII